MAPMLLLDGCQIHWRNEADISSLVRGLGGLTITLRGICFGFFFSMKCPFVTDKQVSAMDISLGKQAYFETGKHTFGYIVDDRSGMRMVFLECLKV